MSDQACKDSGVAPAALNFPLSAIEVRPVIDAAGRARWDRVMAAGHYLGFRGMFGHGIRHVATGPDGEWLALLGWCAGAFKVKARDAWIGRAPEQLFRRLPENRRHHRRNRLWSLTSLGADCAGPAGSGRRRLIPRPRANPAQTPRNHRAGMPENRLRRNQTCAGDHPQIRYRSAHRKSIRSPNAVHPTRSERQRPIRL